MKWKRLEKKILLLLVVPVLMNLFSACAQPLESFPFFTEETGTEEEKPDYISMIEDDPDTVDFQCTTIHYTIATNVFDRLVRQEGDVILPSLAESWEVSEDGMSYLFHLRDVRFSNQDPLTASDVEYTLIRLLTHPDSASRDIAQVILGADALIRGETDRLEGFEVLGEHDFRITLEEPFEAFLACLSMPAASILNEETTKLAGDRFGTDPAWTIGTGPFIMEEWIPGEEIRLKANPDCWSGAPACDGVRLLLKTDPAEIRTLFDEGELDILDLDEAAGFSEYYMHGDIYRYYLHEVNRIEICYIAMNERITPLNDARVRKAMQMALNREVLLKALYSGGRVENGIMPEGLYGSNPDLPEIPYDPEQAAGLLAEAGYPDGFDLTVTVRSSSTQAGMNLMRLASSMWKKIGISAEIEVVSDEEFMRRRKKGEVACYTASWTADFNDPDNFFTPFFASWENSVNRSLCYPRTEIMDRVRAARGIKDPAARIAEYQELEKIIIQEDAAWIPLFLCHHFYVTSERLSGFVTDWNGSVKNMFRYMSVTDPEGKEAEE